MWGIRRYYILPGAYSKFKRKNNLPNKLESGIKQYRVFVSQNCRGCGDSGNQPRLDKLGVFMEKMGTEMQMETTEWSTPKRIADHSLEVF